MDANEIIETLKALRGFKTDKQLADYLGIKPNTLSSWKDRNSVNIKAIIAKYNEGEIANILSTYSIGREDENKQKISHEDLTQYYRKVEIPSDLKIPYFEVPVSAGSPSYVSDELMIYFYPAKRFHEGTFMVKVKGSSMEPVIYNGDELLVDTKREPKEGNIVIASIYGDMTVKKIKKINGTILLHPENQDYDPILVNEDVKIMGVVTKIIHDALN